jgi:hypothetical protein
MISAEIICDSVAPHGKRITTFLLKYPRFIHSELLTHRQFSRNASSSRAIPFKRLVKNTLSDMAMPISFRANKPGMQAGAELSFIKQFLCRTIWTLSGYVTAGFALLMHYLGAHKQYVNRLIEPWGHITVVVTSTEYDNFFALRYHKDAQPEIHELARQMWNLYQASRPQRIDFGDWHLPFVGFGDRLQVADEFDPIADKKTYYNVLCMVSAARCARTSYLNHDKKNPTLSEDLELFIRLSGSVPKHMSPTEHSATPAINNQTASGNFTGWIQFRKLIRDESVQNFTGPIDAND